MANSLQMAITANTSSTDGRVTGDSEGDNQGDRRCFDARIHGGIIKGPNSGFDFLLRRKGEFIQAKLEPGVADATSLQTASKLTPESLVRVLGSFLKDQSSANSIVPTKEIAIFQIAKIELLSAAAERLPNTLKLHGAPGEFTPPAEQRDRLINDRLDNRLLESRVAATAAIFKVFSGVHELAIAYLGTHDFQFIPTPACVAYRFPGEDDDHFMLPFFEGTAMLAPTGEIHLGMALAADLERVYDFHTVFRREPASDGRHLTEFTMLELVFRLQNDWTEILDFADNLLVFLIRSLQDNDKYAAHLQAAKRLYPSSRSFKLGLNSAGRLIRLTFREAKAILRDKVGLRSNELDDLTREEEAALGRFLASNESNLGPATDIFIVTHFPRHLKPCNVHQSDEDSATSQSFDIIMRGQEIVTGCRLVHDYEELRAAFINRSPPIDPDSPEWRPYMIAHEIGMPPWGGFGLGINRLVQGILGLADIRETVLFPRDAARLMP